MLPKFSSNLHFLALFDMFFFEVDLGTPKTWKSVFYLHHMLIFEDSRVREFTPKMAPKSLKIWKKTCLEMLCFWYSFFCVFFSILSQFWLILELQRPLGSLQNQVFFEHGSKMVSKRPSGSIWGRFWLHFGTVLGCSGSNFGLGFRIQCVIPARSPAWLSHTFFVFPLQRGGTCAAHGIKTPGVIFHGESDFRWIIFSNFWKKWKVEKSYLS